jgi:hypothetical protein
MGHILSLEHNPRYGIAPETTFILLCSNNINWLQLIVCKSHKPKKSLFNDTAHVLYLYNLHFPVPSMNRLNQTEPATFSILPCWAFFRDSVFIYFIHHLNATKDINFKFNI